MGFGCPQICKHSNDWQAEHHKQKPPSVAFGTVGKMKASPFLFFGGGGGVFRFEHTSICAPTARIGNFSRWFGFLMCGIFYINLLIWKCMWEQPDRICSLWLPLNDKLGTTKVASSQQPHTQTHTAKTSCSLFIIPIACLPTSKATFFVLSGSSGFPANLQECKSKLAQRCLHRVTVSSTTKIPEHGSWPAPGLCDACYDQLDKCCKMCGLKDVMWLLFGDFWLESPNPTMRFPCLI